LYDGFMVTDKQWKWLHRLQTQAHRPTWSNTNHLNTRKLLN